MQVEESEVKVLVTQSCLFFATPWTPHGPQLTRLLCVWDVSSKNIGVDCHFPFQGIF